MTHKEAKELARHSIMDMAEYFASGVVDDEELTDEQKIKIVKEGNRELNRIRKRFGFVQVAEEETEAK